MTETLLPDVLMPDVLLNDAQIDEAVAFINERVAAHVYRGSLEIGEYVLVRFFNNNIRLAGSMNGHKSVSYSKLCNHPELCVSRSTLTNMVKTFAQEGFLNDGGISSHEMKYSHKIALTRMENNEEKLALARECIEENISVEELKQRVREIRAQSISQTVSPVMAAEKHLMRVQRWIRGVSTPDGLTDRNVIAGADHAERQKMLDMAGGILEDMSVITNAIRQLVTILTETPEVPAIETPPSPGEA
ncbi:MAG: hypothetical protein C4518_11805 [Desulfobacteraceae bacterium]|nr:MAG: hypothetical protein C4518_11805 [Desulfobacteraceae bacterium]